MTNFQMARSVGTVVALSLVVQVTPIRSAKAAPIFFGPVPYLSEADIPAGFYAAGVPVALEDFEDGSLDFGMVASTGILTSSQFPASVDSVDADDGTIDGSGSSGESWHLVPLGNGGPGAFSGLTITFLEPATAAGAVWTDGDAGGASVIFEALGPGMISLGTIGPFFLGDSRNDGGTSEDRFFGVHNSEGVVAIRFTHPDSDGGIEIDHVQFGVPESTTAVLVCEGIVALQLTRRRCKRRVSCSGRSGEGIRGDDVHR